VSLGSSKISGFFYLTPLNSTRTEGLPPPSFKNLLMSSFSPEPASRFGTCLKSSGIPTKVYLDVNLSTSKFRVSYGNVLGPHMPHFLEIIERMVPPSSDPVASRRQVKIGWWDNLRFWLHGRVNIDARVFEYRHLLDVVDLRERCILWRSESTRLRYSTGKFEWDLRNVVVSVPRESYPFMDVKVKDRNTSSSKAAENERDPSDGRSSRVESMMSALSPDDLWDPDVNGRHSLMLVPTAKVPSPASAKKS
jgi:hypothetical protein